MSVFDPKRAPAALRRPEVVASIVAALPPVFCDLCHHSRRATCERRVGPVRVSVCDVHRDRIDHAGRISADADEIIAAERERGVL